MDGRLVSSSGSPVLLSISPNFLNISIVTLPNGGEIENREVFFFPNLYVTKNKKSLFFWEHATKTRWTWTRVPLFFLSYTTTLAHAYSIVPGGISQLVKLSVNVTQLTSASMTSWNENISKHWIWKQKILSWSWNTSMCFGERSGSFASHKQVIVERLQILTVGIAREVVVLLSFSSICRESLNGKPWGYQINTNDTKRWNKTFHGRLWIFFEASLAHLI